MPVISKAQAAQGEQILGGAPGGSFSLPGASYFSGEAQRGAQDLLHIDLPPLLGNIDGQIQAGQQIYAQIVAGDVQGLLSDGIDLIGNAVGGVGGTLIDVGGGALSGLAIAGPWGAAAAGLLSIAGDLLGGGADTVAAVIGESKATQMISASIASLLKQQEGSLGHQQGWAMADYLAFASPPNKTKRVSTFMSMMRNVAQYAWNNDPGFNQPYWSRQDGPSNLANALCGDTGFQPSCNYFTPQQFVGWQVPICTPVLFQWNDVSAIQNCTSDLIFGSGGAGGSVSKLKSTWISQTPLIPGVSQEQIVENAIAKAPDPLYWGSDLYGVVTNSGAFASGYATYYFNLDLMNGFATVLAMRSVYASTMSVVAELLLQAALLKEHGNVDANGNALRGHTSNNQYGFFQLLNDHIQMAINEDKTAGVTPTQALTSSWSPAAIVAATVGIAAVGGILGYSAYTRQSPVTVVKSMGSRLRARF